MSRGKLGGSELLDSRVQPLISSKHTQTFKTILKSKKYSGKQTRLKQSKPINFTDRHKTALSDDTKIAIYPSEICVKCKGIYARTTEKLRFFGHRFLRGWRHASRAALLVLMTSVFSWITHITALASPYWEYLENDYGSSHSGLWTVCILGRCDAFSNHPLYGWFHVVQTCMLLSFFTLTTSLILLCCYLFPRGHDLIKRRFIAAAAVMISITCVLCTIAVVIYGLDQGEDPTSLSWGYAMATISMVTELIAAIVTMIECKCVWRRFDRIEMAILAQLDTPPEVRRFTHRLQRSESMPETHEDVFSETAPLNTFEVRNRVNSYTATPETPTVNARDRAFSFNVIRERSESLSSVQDPFSRSLNIS